MKTLFPKEYEDFVERVLLEMDIWKSATVYRNKRFPGVRQAGCYEVDIALHLHLTELVSFLLIVECKNHARPVTRPIVQQLAQTRDAIAAQKGAIVSPVGFSAESVDVAKHLGIALWVMGQDVPTQVVMAYDGVKVEALSDLFLKLRVSYLGVFGLVPAQAPRDYLQLVEYVATTDLARLEPARHSDTGLAPGFCTFGRGVSTGSYFFTFQNDRLFDHECATNHIVRWVLETCSDELLRDVRLRQRLEDWRNAVGRFARDNNYDSGIIEHVEADDWPGFYSCFDSIPREHLSPF